MSKATMEIYLENPSFKLSGGHEIKRYFLTIEDEGLFIELVINEDKIKDLKNILEAVSEWCR